jgi:hypothetical protein
MKEKKDKKKKKNPLDELLDELEKYDEGCDSHDLMSSGE